MKSRFVAIVAGIMLVTFLALRAPAVFALPPIINNQSVSIPENATNGTATSPGQIIASDPEQGSNNLTFLVTGGTGQTMFDVSPTGTITYNGTGTLDYESATKSYTLVVQVSDTQANTASATVTVNVSNVSDVTPTIENQSFNVAENSPNNSVVGTIEVTDTENDAHNYTVTGGNGTAIFDVNSSSGQIKVTNSAALDYETPPNSYTLDVDVKDVGSGSSNSATMTITVTDVNEPPVTPVTYDFSVSEGAANGTTVGTVSGVDPEGLSVSYAIVGQTPFSIGAADGIIKVANASQLDFETQPQIVITVKASDPGNNSTNSAVTIQVTDENDAPQTSGIPDVVINEGTIKSDINLRLYFSDSEDTAAALVFNVQNNSNPGLFTNVQIDPNSDVLTLTYNANAAGIANITIRATDAGGKYVDSTFKVDINDAPTTSGIADFSVNEDAANTNIDLYGVFNDAEDADANLVYAIVSNSNPGLVSSSLSSQHILVLDYSDNANGNATIKVKATDTGGLVVETQFKVTVIPVNDAPTTTGINDVQVDEDAPDKVIQLFPAFADLEDADADLTYTVQGNTNAGLFTGGTPSIAQSQQSATLTLKFKPNTSGESTITIRATDTGKEDPQSAKKYVETSFKVTVGVAADKPVLSDFTKNTNEDTVLAFTKQDFVDHFVDDDGEPLVKVKIVSLPNKGTLKRGTVTLQVNDEVTANDLNTLTFTPQVNWDTGTTTFEWNATDGNDYADKAAKVEISVNAVNDAPEVSDFTKIGDEDKTIDFLATDFNTISTYEDVENDALVSIRIESLPANGTLKLGGNTVSTNQVIGVNNLGTLKFVPDSNWSGTTSFGWNASDGQLFAALPALVNITINPKNDAPAIDLNGPAAGTGYSTLFNANAAPAIVGGPNMTVTDPDGDMLTAAYIKINQAPDGAAEILDADKTGTNIKVNYNPSKHTLTLQGPDTIANFIKVLKTVTYDNASATPDPSARSIRFELYDGQSFSNTAVTSVAIVRPAILLTVETPFQTVISGDTALFTLTIANTGDVDLKNVTLTSSVSDCDKGMIKETLEAGETLPPVVCAATNVTDRIDNLLVVTAEDTTGGPPVLSSVTAVVRVSNPNIYVEILADPNVGYTVPKGTDVPLIIIVGNPSQAKLRDVTLTATLKPVGVEDEGRSSDDTDLPFAVECDFGVVDLNGGQQKEFSCVVHDVISPIALEVSAVGTIDGTATTVEDFDRAEINVLDITIQATTDLFEIAAGNATDVEFSITLTNSGSKPVTLTELTSRNKTDQLLFGNLLDATNTLVKDSTCQIAGNAPVLDANGGTFACKFTGSVLAEVPEFVNRISFTVKDEDDNSLSDSDDIVLVVNDESGVRAILNASPTSIVAPGGDIKLLVQIRNNLGIAVNLTDLQGSQTGDLNGKGDCQVPQNIAANDSYLCSYTVTRSGLSAGDELTFVLTATVDGENLTDSALVRVTERGNRQVIIPVIPLGTVAGEPNNFCLDAEPLRPGVEYRYFADDQQDWYRVEMDKPGTIHFELSNYEVKGQLNVYIAPDCSSLSSDTGKFFSDGSEGEVLSVRLENAPAGTYFVRVYGPDPHGGPVITSLVPYVLRVTTSSP